MARKKKTLKVWRDGTNSYLLWTWGEVWLDEETLGEVTYIDGEDLWCEKLSSHVVELFDWLDWLDYIPTEPYYLEIE